MWHANGTTSEARPGRPASLPGAIPAAGAWTIWSRALTPLRRLHHLCHHRPPHKGRAMGDDPAHLVAACAPCNGKVGDPTRHDPSRCPGPAGDDEANPVAANGRHLAGSRM
jgi:hypothetical protein